MQMQNSSLFLSFNNNNKKTLYLPVNNTRSISRLIKQRDSDPEGKNERDGDRDERESEKQNGQNDEKVGDLEAFASQDERSIGRGRGRGHARGRGRATADPGAAR